MKTTIIGLASSLVLIPAAMAAPPASEVLIDELTRDLAPSHPAAVEVEQVPVREQVAEVAPRIAPAAPPAPAPERAAEPVPAKKKGTPLGTLAEREKERSAAPSGGGLGWAMVALSLMALAGVAIWLRKRATPGGLSFNNAANIETLGTTRIFGKHTVGLVRVGGRVLVIGYSDKGLSLLTELDEREVPGLALAGAPANSEADAGNFLSRLSRMRGTWGVEAPEPDPFHAALEEENPADELVQRDERAAIRERLEALRRRSIAVA